MSAAARWQRLVRARLEAFALLDDDHDGVHAEFWDERAGRYARRVAGSAPRDPLVPRIRPHLDDDTVLLDVGAGSGRFSLALAPHVREVVAVDPSRGMLELLQAQADEHGVTNVRTVVGRFEETDGVAGDVVLCAHVLPVLPDAATFLDRLDRAAGRRVVVYLSVGSSDLRSDPLWRHFHGDPRPPAPTYLDAVAVLGELGITPHVEVVEVPPLNRYASLDEAVDDHLDGLRVDPSRRDELAGLLEAWLVRDDDGGLRAPVPALPAAVLSWAPRGG